MQLPFLKKTPSPNRREYFLALEIDHFQVKSAIWAVINSLTQVLAVGSPSTWDDATPDSLISASDSTLSDATNRLDPQGTITPQKVIFGLPSDWVTAEGISPAHRQTLRSLSAKLSLQAVGYVVTAEAAVKFLQHQEGLPPTAILIGFWPRQLEITLVRLGKIEATHQVVRSPNLESDVVEGLTRFAHLDMLPSRMLLYDSGMDLESIEQRLLAHPWKAPQTRLPFLHFPKIESLPSDFTIRAVAAMGGTEVAKAAGLIVPPPEPAEPDSPSPAADLSPEDLGFSDSVVSPPIFTPAPYAPAPVSPPASRALPKIKLPRLAFPRFSLPRALPFLLLGLLLPIALGLGYWYLPKATVVLSIRPETLTSTFEITADSQFTAPDQARFIVPAESVTAEVTVEKSQPATGTKLVGDRASGQVAIINGTSIARKLASGTVLTSPSGLKFTLDTAVDIASASGTADPNSYQPGKATVKVTAAAIGTDYNLSAGTQFRVDTFSTLDIVAKNEAALSGGSSRQVKAVSKADLASLRTALQTQAKTESVDKLKSQISPPRLLISESVTSQTTQESFSAKEGEAVDELSLKLTLQSRGLAVSQSDLDTFLKDKISSQIPSGYSFLSTKSSSFTVGKTTGTATTLTAQATAVLAPSLNPDNLVADLVGRPLDSSTDYLKSLPGVVGVDYQFNFRLPGSLLTLPRVKSNISLELQSAP